MIEIPGFLHERGGNGANTSSWYALSFAAASFAALSLSICFSTLTWSIAKYAVYYTCFSEWTC